MKKRIFLNFQKETVEEGSTSDSNQNLVPSATPFNPGSAPTLFPDSAHFPDKSALQLGTINPKDFDKIWFIRYILCLSTHSIENFRDTNSGAYTGFFKGGCGREAHEKFFSHPGAKPDRTHLFAPTPLFAFLLFWTNFKNFFLHLGANLLCTRRFCTYHPRCS